MKKRLTSAVLAVALVSASGIIISAPANAAMKKPAVTAVKPATTTKTTVMTTKPVKPVKAAKVATAAKPVKAKKTM